MQQCCFWNIFTSQTLSVKLFLDQNLVISRFLKALFSPLTKFNLSNAAILWFGFFLVMHCVPAAVPLFSGWVESNPHTCRSIEANLSHLLLVMKKQLIQRLLASLLQTSLWWRLAPCFLVVRLLSSPGFFVFSISFPLVLCAPLSSLCSTTIVANSNRELCLASIISSPPLCFRVCVVGSVTSRA